MSSAYQRLIISGIACTQFLLSSTGWTGSGEGKDTDAPATPASMALAPNNSPVLTFSKFDAKTYELAYKVFLINNQVDAAYQLSKAAVGFQPNNILWRKRYAQTALWSGHMETALDQWLYLYNKGIDKDIYAPQIFSLSRQLKNGALNLMAREALSGIQSTADLQAKQQIFRKTTAQAVQNKRQVPHQKPNAHPTNDHRQIVLNKRSYSARDRVKFLWLLNNQQDYQRLQKYLILWRRELEENPKFWRVYAVSLSSLGRKEQALKIYLMNLDKVSKDYKTLLKFADMLEQNHDAYGAYRVRQETAFLLQRTQQKKTANLARNLQRFVQSVPFGSTDMIQHTLQSVAKPYINSEGVCEPFPYMNQVKAGAGYYSYTHVNGAIIGLAGRYQLMPTWSIMPFNQTWLPRNHDQDDIANVPHVTTYTGVRLRKEVYSGFWEARFAQYKALGQNGVLGLSYDQLLTSSVQGQLYLNVNEKTTDSLPLLLAGMRRNIGAFLNYEYDPYNQLGVQFDYSRYYGQDNFYIGSGKGASIYWQHQFALIAPDWNFNLYGNWRDFQDTHRPLSAFLNQLVPGNLLGNTSFYMPISYTNVMAKVGYGQYYRVNFNQALRLFAEAGIAYSKAFGLGKIATAGVMSPIFGPDKFMIYADYENNIGPVAGSIYSIWAKYNYYF